MASPLIILNGKSSQLGTGVLEVNSIEAITGTTISSTSLLSVSVAEGADAFRAGSSTHKAVVYATATEARFASTTNSPLQVIPGGPSSGNGLQLSLVGGWISTANEGGDVVIAGGSSSLNTITKTGDVFIRSPDPAAGGNSSTGNINTYSGNATGTGNSGAITINTGNAATGLAGDIKIYTGYGQTATQSGGIVIETNGGSTITPVDDQITLSSNDIVFQARGSTNIPLNEAGAINLPSNITSIVQGFTFLSSYSPFAIGFPTYGKRTVLGGQEDFLYTSDGLSGVIAVSVGTNASAGTDATSYSDRVGIAYVKTGDLATGHSRFTSSPTSVRFGGGRVRTSADVIVTSALSDGTETYRLVSGFHDSTPDTDGTDGIFFRYTHSVNTGKFECVTRSGGVETATDSGVTFAILTWYQLAIEVNAGATSVAFYINGTLVQTHTTNIPSGTAITAFCPVGIAKSVGTTSRAAYIDRWEWEFAPTTSM